MRLLKPTIALLTIVLFSCTDSINGPKGSDLTYEPQILSVGEEAEFGTIGEDTIKVKLAGLDGKSYVFEHSNNMSGQCPSNTDKMRLELVMCCKYKVTFVYRSLKANIVSLQLYKYERL